MNPGSGDWLTATHSWRYSLDGQEWVSTLEPTFRLSSLPPGPHTLNVSAVDAMGNWDPHARQVNWVTWAGASTGQKALAVEALPATTSTTAHVRLGGWSKGLFRWRLDAGLWVVSHSPSLSLIVTAGRPHFLEAVPGAGDEGVCLEDPIAIEWTALEGSNVLLIPNLEEGFHEIWVKAVDEAGNIDPVGANWGFNVDTVRPEGGCALQAVPLGIRDTCFSKGVLQSTECSLLVTGLGEPLSRAVALVDDDPTEWHGLVDGDNGNSGVLNVSVTTEGVHVLHVWVEDRAGNRSPLPCSNWSWTYDPNPPWAGLLNPEDLPTLTKNNTFDFQVERNRKDVTVWWRLDQGPWRATTMGVLVDKCTVVANEGDHTLSLRARDVFGNVVEFPNSEFPHQHSWRVDTTNPTAALSGPPSPYPLVNATFNFSCSSEYPAGSGAPDCESFLYVVTKTGSKCPEHEGRLPATGQKLLKYPLSGLGLEGARVFYTLAVSAVDAAGNVQDPPATFTLEVFLPVDNYLVNITTELPKLYAFPTATINFNAYFDGRILEKGVTKE